MNQVNIIGRLGKDPDLRYTQKGNAVVNLSMAVNDRYGETERTYWFQVICWNGLAEVVAEHLSKGSRVGVCGRLIQRSYETENGKRTTTEIVANSVDFLDPRSTSGSPGNQTSATAAGDPADADNDDIPF